MCGFVVPVLAFLFLYMMYVTVNLSHIYCIAYILIQILSEMKLRFGIDIEVVLRASITDRAASMVNKVASLTKILTKRQLALLLRQKGCQTRTSRKVITILLFFFSSLFCVQQIYFELKIINCID